MQSKSKIKSEKKKISSNHNKILLELNNLLKKLEDEIVVKSNENLVLNNQLIEKKSIIDSLKSSNEQLISILNKKTIYSKLILDKLTPLTITKHTYFYKREDYINMLEAYSMKLDEQNKQIRKNNELIKKFRIEKHFTDQFRSSIVFPLYKITHKFGKTYIGRIMQKLLK